MTQAAPPDERPRILSRGNGASIAYHRLEGRTPGVVFLTGFKSDMTGGKALALESLCRARGQAFLRFDYTGHGASSGKFEDGAIGQWAEDAADAFDQLTKGPQVLVGSSMGGWIALLVAIARRERVAGLVGVAAAPDFTEDLVWDAFTPAQRTELTEKGRINLANDYGEDPYVITRALIEDGRQHLLLRGAPIPLACPVRLIQGMEDADVPWRTALRLSEHLVTDDVEVTLVKSGNHRLSEPEDLDRLCRTVSALLDGLEKNELRG